jgi:hypothetical protein
MAGFFSLFRPRWAVSDFLMVREGAPNSALKALGHHDFSFAVFQVTVKSTVMCHSLVVAFDIQGFSVTSLVIYIPLR